MELIIALVVLAAGAALVLRSAFESHPPQTDEPSNEVEEPEAIEEPEATEMPELPPAPDQTFTPLALLPEKTHANGNVAEATTMTDRALPIPSAPLPAPPIAAPPVVPDSPATPVASGAVATEKRVHVHTLITEDLRLDDVLAAAEEEYAPPGRPALRLLAAIAGLALGFAATILLAARGLQALWNAVTG